GPGRPGRRGTGTGPRTPAGRRGGSATHGTVVARAWTPPPSGGKGTQFGLRGSFPVPECNGQTAQGNSRREKRWGREKDPCIFLPFCGGQKDEKSLSRPRDLTGPSRCHWAPSALRGKSQAFQPGERLEHVEPAPGERIRGERIPQGRTAIVGCRQTRRAAR